MFNSLAKKDIDLLQAYNRKTEPSPYEGWLKAALIPLCIVLIYAGVFAWQKVGTITNNGKIDKLDKEISKYKKQISDLGDKDYNEYQEYQNKNGDIDKIIKTLDSHPALNGSLIGTFSSLAFDAISIQSIGYEEGMFTISLNTVNVLNVEKYVASIRSVGVFDEVKYTGYQKSESVVEKEEEKDGVKVPVTSISKYNFQIICTLKGGN